MKGLQPATALVLLLLLLTANGEQEDAAAEAEKVETGSDSSEEATPSEIGDQLGASEEEECSDCEERRGRGRGGEEEQNLYLLPAQSHAQLYIQRLLSI